MVRLGGSATQSHFDVFVGLEEVFRRRGIELEWVLYSDYDTMVDAFVDGYLDLAWNGPLGYVKIKRLLEQPCQVIAMRDVDVGLVTRFIARQDSEILTVEDLVGKRVAFGRRGSEQAGLIPYHMIKTAGLDPNRDLADASFFEDRETLLASDEPDVVQRVSSGEFDAGAVSGKTLETMTEDGDPAAAAVRAFWSSAPYSHCCFTAQRGLDPALGREIESAFLSISGSDEVEQAVLRGEACDAFVPGISHGWELVEAAAVAEGLA